MSLFHCESMLHVSFYMQFDQAPLTSIILAKSGSFEPKLLQKQNRCLPDKQGDEYRHNFNQALSKWKKISEYLNIPISKQVDKISSVEQEQLIDSNTILDKFWQDCLLHKDKQRLLDKKQKSLQHLLALLDNFKGLDIDLSLLKRGFEFLDIRLGIIPSAYIDRLKQALTIEGYLVSVYLEGPKDSHIIVAGAKQLNDSINAVLESASFHPLQIPEEFHECPQLVYKELEKKKHSLHLQTQVIKNEYQLLQKHQTQQIIKISHLLTLAKPYALLSKKMLRNGQLVKLDGWIPKQQLSQIKSQLNNQVTAPVIVKTREPKAKEYTQTPSYLLRPDWLKPFIQLISNYGVPGYKEFDPSWFFSLSYILMFGIMFGDIGHGVSIIIMAILLKNKWPQLFTFLFSIGLSSSIFGLMYGSIFAFEHIIVPLWMTPMNDTNLMLKLALLWGISFIIFLNLIYIYNSLIRQKFKLALFTANGLSGLILYIATIWLIINMLSTQVSLLDISLMLIPMLIIFSYQWRQSKSKIIERLLVSLIDTYEVILSYFSNTLSFIRIGAFALNHSALAIAIFTLASMTDGHWHWLTIIAGNLFILVLEGAIVAIQVLRLEYYEGFSRYYKADGYLFKPLNLSPKQLLEVYR